MPHCDVPQLGVRVSEGYGLARLGQHLWCFVPVRHWDMPEMVREDDDLVSPLRIRSLRFALPRYFRTQLTLDMSVAAQLGLLHEDNALPFVDWLFHPTLLFANDGSHWLRSDWESDPGLRGQPFAITRCIMESPAELRLNTMDIDLAPLRIRGDNMTIYPQGLEL